MRAVVQRVSSAAVHVDAEKIAAIDQGLMVLIAAGENDDSEDATLLANKIVGLRIFADEAGKMNLSVIDICGHILGISQFTLFGDARKGRRPSFTTAMKPKHAESLYLQVIYGMENAGVKKVATGRFGADMKITLTNDGPVTILLDTKKKF